MSMLKCFTKIKCGVGRTKSNVGIEYDINKLVRKYKLTGRIPKLELSGSDLSANETVIDLVNVGDFTDAQNRIAGARQIFDSYPSVIRRRFREDIAEFLQFVSDCKTDAVKAREAVSLGILQINEKPKGDTTVIDKAGAQK